jgi:hypothetical protein
MKRFSILANYISLIVFIFTLCSVAHSNNDNFKLQYNELANNFHILDQISKSFPVFFEIPAYQQELNKNFQNTELLDKYRKLRIKYQTIPSVFIEQSKTDSEIIFAPSPDEVEDPILDAFFTSSNLDDAINSLSNLLSLDEINLLRTTFQYYSEIFQQINEDNQPGIIHNVKIINEHINQIAIDKHCSDAKAFYQSSLKNLKSILLIWCPESAAFSGNAYGNHLIIRTSHKKIDDNIVKLLVSVIAHEATHLISANASYKQKQKLSQHFLIRSDISKIPHVFYAIEEPLALAFQMLFVETNYPEIFEDQYWLNLQWARKILPLVKDYIASRKTIDTNFITICSDEYNLLNC